MDESFKDWKIVSSRTGYGIDGFPVGQILCRTEKDINEAKNQIHEKNLEIKYYNETP